MPFNLSMEAFGLANTLLVCIVHSVGETQARKKCYSLVALHRFCVVHVCDDGGVNVCGWISPARSFLSMGPYVIMNVR